MMGSVRTRALQSISRPHALAGHRSLRSHHRTGRFGQSSSLFFLGRSSPLNPRRFFRCLEFLLDHLSQATSSPWTPERPALYSGS